MNRFMQTLLALSGLIISGLLGYQTLNSQREQAQQEMISLFTQQVNFAMTVCDEKLLALPGDIAADLQDKLYDDYLVTASQRIEACKKGETLVGAASPTTAAPTAPPAQGAAPTPTIAPPPVVAAPAPTQMAQRPVLRERVATDIVSQSRNIELRTTEGLRGIKSARASANWYAVLASYSPEEAKVASERYAELRAQMQSSKMGAGAAIAIYRTDISDLYAIVIDASASRERAQYWVDTARREGWARDAFLQDNRNWVKCDNPMQLSACAAPQ